MRKPIVVGNWKMHKTVQESVALVEELKPLVADVQEVEIGVCPPFTSLSDVSKVLEGSKVHLGAQNMYWEPQGAYTGEISAGMLLAVGCKYVIIGHSERRSYFGETDEWVNRKVKAALDAGLVPIVCVGETLEQRQKGITREVVDRQVTEGLKGLSPEQVAGMVIAYEPVWAIGTGLTAKPEQAQEVHSFIRRRLEELFGEEAARSVRIQYGGSIKPENAGELFAQPDVDGGLVGGASLKADSFARIIRAAIR
ncbi:MAG: triose-phosphate isomerase [Candidatus Latescibacterota bacterium]|nr:MAG: triose-phosphate isomerase [Candidatus Latescibacterota bacterium]